MRWHEDEDKTFATLTGPTIIGDRILGDIWYNIGGSFRAMVYFSIFEGEEKTFFDLAEAKKWCESFFQPDGVVESYPEGGPEHEEHPLLTDADVGAE